MGILPERPLYRRLLITGAVLGVLFCGVAGWAFFQQGGLQSRIEAIRAAGDPATIADLAPAGFPPEDEDAGAQLAAVADRLKDFSQELGRFYKTPLGSDYDEQCDRDLAATAEQLDGIKSIVDKYPDLDAAITRAAACPRYVSRLDYRLPQPQFLAATFPGSIDIRSLARFVAWQMELSIAAGRPELALEQGIELLRLAALFAAGEPGLISGQMANAVRGVAAREIYEAVAADQGSITMAQRQELDRELARFDAGETLRHALKTERACVVSATQHQIGSMSPIVANTIGLQMKTMYLDAVDSIEPALAIADEPWHETFQAGKPNIFQPTAKRRPMADLMAPALMAEFESVHRTSASLRALRVVNALQQFAAEQGREASGLVELNLPPEATVDPFSGQPLMVKASDRGWVVYSIGKDGVDDGGNFETQKDVGFGPPNLQISGDEAPDVADDDE